jgi:restriction endonuclease Mrr
LLKFRDMFLGGDEPSKEDLGYRIGQMTGLSKSTAERRAGTLIAWRRYVLGDVAQSVNVESHAEAAKKIHEQIEAQNAKALQDYLYALQTMNATSFEKLVGELIKKMGYKLVKHVGGPGDGGVDVRALREDQWGGEHKVVIQAKRYQKTVGRRFVHEHIGVMHTGKCQEGLLITTGTFDKEALEAAAQEGPALILVDGRNLVQRLITHEIGWKRDANGAIVPVEKAKTGTKTSNA